MLNHHISAFITQDPQEMFWIETQASILVIIAICLLCIWPLAEYSRYYEKRKQEEIIKHGVEYLFSFTDDTK